MKPFYSILLLVLLCATFSASLAQTSSLKFNGTDSYVQLDTVLPIGSTSNTVEMWIRVPFPGTEGLGTNQRVGILLGNFNSSPNAGWEVHSQGDLRFWWNNGQIDIRGTTTDLRDNAWHHVAIVRDKENNRILGYIDGNLEFEHASAGTDINFTTTHKLGADNRATGTPYFHGEMDEIRIWSVARTQEQIRENLLKQLAGDETGLIAYYRMTDGSGTTLTDNSTNAPAISGTLFGSTIWTTDHLIPLGAGTEANPYEIATLNNLYWLSDNSSLWSSGTHFRQVENIDASSTETWYGGKGFSPIGFFSSNPFEGIYDGNGHFIDHLTINRSDQQYIGLFGYLKNAHILNIGLTNSSLTGSNYVGGLAGRSDNSTIEKCFTDGEITGNDTLGGLLAYSLNTNTFNSYSTANITGSDRGGGLIGDLENSEIRNSYAAGNLNDEMTSSGGLVGASSGSAFANSFWDISASGQSTSAEGEGKTTDEMNDVYTFLDAGWDFVSETDNGDDFLWDMDVTSGGINDGYPILSWQVSEPNIREFKVNLNGDEGWRLLSAPGELSYSRLLEPIWTQGAEFGANTTSGTPNVYIWPDEPGKDPNEWAAVRDLRNQIPAGSGFLVYVYGDDNYDGINNNFPKTLSMFGLPENDSVIASLNSNSGAFSLIGNPYSGTIDFNALSISGLTDVAYVWDPNDTGGDGGTEENAPGGSWKTWNGEVGDLSGGRIAPFQGFLFKTKKGQQVVYHLMKMQFHLNRGYFSGNPKTMK
ncbi:MAG: LamG domain-containing protein [Balneolaceae bacterium]|nr:MAG: LamG domain-containing protein [Balneolaceae bacterium]